MLCSVYIRNKEGRRGRDRSRGEGGGGAKTPLCTPFFWAEKHRVEHLSALLIYSASAASSGSALPLCLQSVTGSCQPEFENSG